MLTNEEIIKMAQKADAIYNKKYAPLTKEYLVNVPAHANLEDVLNGKCTMEHAQSITNYSGAISRVLNNSIRCGYLDSTTELKMFDFLLTTALRSLPEYNNQLVYRMEKNGPAHDVYEKYFTRHKGCILNIPCYLSTSTMDWNCTMVVYRIQTLTIDSHARDISKITNMANETEILFCKNTNFLIKEVLKVDGKVFIDMEETEEQAVAVINYYDDPDRKDTINELKGLFD